jgi:hypothetical protein
MVQTKSDSERKRLQRERTAKSREKAKQRAANGETTNEQRRKEEFDDWRRRDRLVFPGELEAFQDAETCADALTVAREFLLVLGEPDVKPGETLLDTERRVIEAWSRVGCPLLNRNNLTLDFSVACVDGFVFDFDTRWVSLTGANEVIDIATLPFIEVPAVPAAVDSPTVEATPTIVNDPALKNYRTPEVIAKCKQLQDMIDADARAIGKKNLQRELDKEKRLGPAYAYEQ